MEANEFKRTVLPLRNKLLKQACQLTGNPENAEDAVQEVMLKLWNSRQELEQYRNLEAFARTLTHHICIDLMRKQKYQEREHGKDTPTADVAHIPEKLYEIQDEVRLIKEIIETLPPLQRSIIHMKDIEEYETEEIAQITGCSPEAIRKNLSRARKNVREIYLSISANKKKNNIETGGAYEY